MGDGRARDARQREDLRERKRLAREEARSIFADVGWRGAGLRVLQVVHEPAFDPGFGWEVREIEGEFAVYQSSVVAGTGFWWAQLLGYSQLTVPSDTLESHWEEVREIAVDLSALDVPIAGCDGEMFQLALFAGFTSVRFTWWSHPPREWVPLHAITLDMIDTFREAAEIEPP